MITNVSIFSASSRDATAAHGALAHAVNVDRCDPEADVQWISTGLAGQIARVEVEGEWPEPTPAGGGERSEITREKLSCRIRTVGGADLELSRQDIRELLGDVNVLVLHAKHHLPVARYLPLARAAFLQMEFGLEAGEALWEALLQLYDLSREAIAKRRPRFAARIDGLADSRWRVDATKMAPAERFPLDGVAETEARPLYRELNDLITAECRRLAPKKQLCTEVLNETAAPLVVVFSGDEEFAFTPGISVDWLKMSQAAVSPRPGLTYVAEPMVDLRLSNDGETTATLEGFNPLAGKALWEAITRQPPSATSKAMAMARPAAVAGAVLLPLLCLVGSLLFGFRFWLIGAVAAALAEVALVLFVVFGARSRSGKKNDSQTASPKEVSPKDESPGHSTASGAAITDVVPEPIKKRTRIPRPSSNDKGRKAAVS